MLSTTEFSLYISMSVNDKIILWILNDVINVRGHSADDYFHNYRSVPIPVGIILPCYPMDRFQACNRCQFS